MKSLLENIHILVIEDNPGDFFLIEEYLTDELKYPIIVHAKTFNEAAGKLKSRDSFRAVLLDLTLPDNRGEKLVTDVVSLAKNTPVIVLTGYENREFGLKALSMGISDYLLKDELNPFVLGKSISYSIERNRISSSLKKSEKEYRDFFNFSPQPIYVYELESLQFIDVNRAAIQHYGYSREEFLQLNLKDIRPKDDIPKLEQVLLDIENSGEPYYEGIYRHQKKNGTLIDVKVKSNIIEHSGKQARLALVTDITAQLKAEREILLSEQRFRSLVQEGSDLIAILDVNTIITYVSGNAKGITGLHSDELIGRNVLDFIHPDDFHRLASIFKGENLKDRFEVEPFRFRNANGNWRWFETIVTDLLKNPAIRGFVANSRDVTEKIEQKQKLRELSLVASKTTEMVVITDSSERITWVNKTFEEITGYSLEECKGIIPGKLLQGPGTDPDVRKKLKRAITEFKPVNAVILNYSKSGTPYWLDLNIDPIFDENGNCTHFISIERDVTEKIEKEIRLRESLERYDIVSKATSDTIWDMDLNNDTMLYNENIYNMFGYNREEVNSVTNWWKHLIHPNDRIFVNQKFREAIAYRIDRFQLEYRFKAADGTYKHIFDRAFVIKDENGEPTRIIGAMQDITQAVEEQEQLKLLESVVTNTNDSVVITEASPSLPEGRKILFVNYAFTFLTGYSSEEAVGSTLKILNGPKTDTVQSAKMDTALDEFLPANSEMVKYRKDGSTFWLHVSNVPVYDKNGECSHWVSIGRDISETKRHEAELRESLREKETLLSEIHHRVKNNLAVISSLMELQAINSNNKQLQESLLASVLRIKSMAEIHEQLYQSESFSQLLFSKSLESLVVNISNTLKTKTTVELNFDIEPLELNINQSVPCSLLVNEVMTNILKHGFINRETGTISISLSSRDNHVVLKITDNGVGLPENFDELGESSMGLKLIHLLSQQIDGKNRLYSDETGTTFILEFKKTAANGATDILP